MQTSLHKLQLRLRSTVKYHSETKMAPLTPFCVRVFGSALEGLFVYFRVLERRFRLRLVHSQGRGHCYGRFGPVSFGATHSRMRGQPHGAMDS